MPHVTVTYTSELGGHDVLDCEVLGPELHSLIVANSGARPEACRIRFIYPQDVGTSLAARRNPTRRSTSRSR
ncbi:hypothetical protein ABZV67_42930 [Streptomyces sp. NPDC005065]|uniref:hypothetical protein n=1 Tax=Streptomyces sp. NPDC005065 TaxID=3154461 RepID=UPI0033B345A2